MDEQTTLILPRRRRRRASYAKYRKGETPKPRKPIKKATKKRKTKPKAKPIKAPYIPKGSNLLTISLSDECMQSIRLVKNKSGWIQGLILAEMQRVYAKHGKPWVDWPK